MYGYIKSHSNYVLKSRHQLTNDGTILERDITTIGGLNQFSKGQVPIYKSSNFIITVNDSDTTTRSIENGKWINNTEGDIWTLQNTSNDNIIDNTEDDDKLIVLKQDFYDLRDFAYYGSCSELVRASIIGILKAFPGELFAPYREGYTNDEAKFVGVKVGYTNGMVSNDNKPIKLKLGEVLSFNIDNEVEYDLEVLDSGPDVDESERVFHINSFSKDKITSYEYDDNGNELSKEEKDAKYAYKEIISATPVYYGDSMFLLDNPFNINIHNTIIGESEIINPLKYFCNGGAKNYELINGKTGKKYQIESVVSDVDSNDIENACSGDWVGTVTIEFEEKISLTINVYVGDNKEIFYMLDHNNFLKMANNDYHIRPHEKWFNKFYNACDKFQKILINPKTTPKYTATLEVINENEFGYYTKIETFTFPTTYGGYNIIGMTPIYDEYTSRLADIAAFYDERFCDNLYRSMTHEAIKNFDWSYTRVYNEESNQDNIVGGEKMAKMLRICAREFDEIKSYIDAIRNCNSVTYDQVSNIPDNFLSDVVELDGWDVRNIYPLRLNEYIEDKNGIKKLDAPTNSEKMEINNQTKANNHLIRRFSEYIDLTFKPYSIIRNDRANGYTLKCSGRNITRTYGDNLNYGSIRDYSDEREYTMKELNNEFLRRLKINSRSILRHKGTIHGMEMLLSLFGLRSKKWYETTLNFENTNNSLGVTGRGRQSELVPYDYEITEYTSFANAIEDPWDAVHQMYKIDWYNSTKTIDYNYYNHNTHSTTMSDYVPYQGLPVSYINETREDGYPKYVKSDGTDGGTNDITKAALSLKGEPITRRFLYPYFSKKETMDGDFYYQMNGGWMSHRIESVSKGLFNFTFDKENNIFSDTDLDEKTYKETLRTIKSVNNLQELLNIRKDLLNDGDVYYVRSIRSNYAVINGSIFTIYDEQNGENINKYVEFTVNNNSISIGNERVSGSILTYDTNMNLTSYDLYDKENGFTFKSYINLQPNAEYDLAIIYGNINKVNSFTLLSDINSRLGTNYFKLESVDYSNSISTYNKATQKWSNGWKQLSYSDNEFYRLNAISDYFKGNNPHCGNMRYDSGYEYFLYFKHLFKYAYEKDLFDERCYPNGIHDINNNIYPIGFKGLINKDEEIRNYDDYLFEDRKVQYFGNYFTSDGKYCIYTDDKTLVNDYIKHYNNYAVEAYDMTKILTCNKADKTPTYGSKTLKNKEVIGFNGDSTTNQIVNNKRLSIKFYLHDSWFTEDGLCEVKYLNDVVIPYLEQMIPSTAIVDICFSNKIKR